jgi:hemerythrin
MPAEWSPELTLNHELLDGQHVEMFRRLSEAAAALDGGQADAIVDAVADFVDVFLDHVAVEEAMMDETAYPDSVAHKNAHATFAADLMQVRAALEREGPTAAVGEAIRTRLPEWLRFHIRQNDAPFGEHLARRRGAQSAPDPRRRAGAPKRPS